jgi:hypothetical protein
MEWNPGSAAAGLPGLAAWSETRPSGATNRKRADARTRTGDPFITSEVLYQLSYVGTRRAV